MKSKFLLLLAFITFGTAVTLAQSTTKQIENMELIDDHGIMVEKFPASNTDENRFTKNNAVFRVGVSFHYSFEHIDKNNQKYFFKYIDSLASWDFVPANETDENTIKQVIISVKPGLQGFDKMIPDYNQTIIGYAYPTATNYEGTIHSASGVIENKANIWMHPPRDKYFEILELNPFPFIKAPYKIGNTWKWTLTIGDHWADGRWKLWTGKIQNEYKYEIVDLKTITTALGELDCFVINSVASSRIGTSKLKSYFNKIYGFVRLEYENIDGSKTNLELINYLDLSNSN